MLNFALIGCGRIALRHSELLGLNQINGAKLIAVCDIIYEKALKIANKFDIPAYRDMNEMINNEKIDVIVILTPSGLHANHVIELAKYGKDILVEKPMALTLEDTDLMIDACKNFNCRLFVVKQNRFNIPVLKLHQAIISNRLGNLVLGTVRVRWSRRQDYYNQDSWRGTWAMDGGVLSNQASHHIDLLLWVMGDVKSVFAYSNTALVDIEAEDTAVVIIKFKNGALGIIEATTATRPCDLEGSISILGEKGNVVIGGYAVNKMQSWAFENLEEEDGSIIEKYSENPPNVYGFGHKAYYNHVVNCISNGHPNIVDGIQGRKSVELINAIYESIETGKEIYIPFKPSKSKLGKN